MVSNHVQIASARGEPDVPRLVAASVVPMISRQGDSPGSPGSPNSPVPKDVPLQALHRRAEPLQISHYSLVQGLDSARRLDAFEWLTQAIDALNLSDLQLFSAFGLLDRFAAASDTPISAGPSAFALVLASMLVALKVNGTQKDLERAKKLVVEVSGSQEPWAAVQTAELSILRRLGFRACTPTSLDLLDRLLGKTLREGGVNYDVESFERCQDLARFLLELALVHEPEAIYGNGHPPLAAALSAALLAIIALGGPLAGRAIHILMGEPLELLDGNSVVAPIAEAIRQRWNTEERNVVDGKVSVVLDKWLRRVGSFGASPPTAAGLQILVVESVAPAVLINNFKRIGSPTGVATLPPPSNLQQVVVDCSVSAEVPVRTCLAPQQIMAQQAPAPCPPGAAPTARKHIPIVSSMSRASASENKASWSKLPSPRHVPRTNSHKARAAGGAARSGGVACRSPEIVSEPLVELTQVLNMLAPRHARGLGGHSGGPNVDDSKPQAPTMATEHLLSSALRMLWPVDRKRQDPVNAAATCREAASLLKEAAAQLASTAASLEGAGGATKFSHVPTLSSETKRRRTVGGQLAAAHPGASPRVSSSPHGLIQRGSPPVRFSGLRV